MLRVTSIAAVGALTGALLVPAASAATQARHKCKSVDEAGNWEVVISHAATKTSAALVASAAAKKGLKASPERDGCSSRYEVVLNASSKSQASSLMRRAKKDGYSAAALEKS